MVILIPDYHISKKKTQSIEPLLQNSFFFGGGGGVE